jgi:hypothetical protein
VSAAVLALLITGWHLPLVFMPQFDLGLPDIASTVLVTFWYAWLFNRSRRQRAAASHCSRHRGLREHRGLWPQELMRSSCLDVDDLLGSARGRSLLIFDRKAWRTAPESAIDRVPGRKA